MQDPCLLPGLTEVRVPVLVVWGDQDPMLPVAFGRADAFPDARFTVIQGAGHLLTAERPQPTFAVIDHFLRSHHATTRTGAAL